VDSIQTSPPHDNYLDPYVSRLCAQLRTNDPSVLPEDSSEYFEPDVPDSGRLEIAEALEQNSIVRRIGLHANHYENLSADAMAKYLAQSKHLLAVKFSHFSFGTAECHQQALSTFIEAIGQSNSVKELDLTCPGLVPASKSLEKLLTRTKTLQSLTVYWKMRGYLEEVAAVAIASGFAKNTTLREIKLFEWQETSLIPVLTALQMHPMLEKVHVAFFRSLAGIDALLRGKHSQLKQLRISTFKGFSVGE
jgi:hypothetical protein